MFVTSAADKQQIFIPNEIVEAITSRVLFKDLPQVACVCKTFRTAAMFLMSRHVLTPLAKHATPMAKHGTSPETVSAMLRAMGTSALVKAFRLALGKTCGTCRRGWTSESLSSLGFSMCEECFEEGGYLPLSVAATKGSWVPRRELELRHMLHAVPLYTGYPQRAYLEIIKRNGRSEKWPKRHPSHWVRAADVEKVSVELFGDLNVSLAARKKIYRAHEEGQRRACNKVWGLMMDAGPHVPTVLEFAEAANPGDVAVFITAVQRTYRELQHFGYLTSQPRWIPEYYGNAVIPGNLKCSGTVLDSHVRYTKYVCVNALQRGQRR